jgi:cardiolipin synthase
VAHGQAEYLHKSSGACLRLEGETDYFPMGEDMFPVLVEELKKAKHFIFMEYFIVEEGKFWNTILDVLKEKVNEGVEVRFMYDDVGSIGKVSVAYAKKLRTFGINAQVFRPFRPFVSVMHNNRDHRKITVIDNEVAFTGGVNLADEYINEVERFGRWKDNSVMVKGEAVKDFTNMFLTLWDLQAGVVSNYRKYTSYPQYPSESKHGNGFVCVYGDGPKPMYMEQVGKNVYLNILNSATEYVYITTPYLVCDNELLSAIRHAAERGVDVRMITPHIPDKKSVYMITRSNYGMLLEGGVKIYEYTPGFIHAKTFVSDDKYAVVSTINLDYRSLVHHYECGLWMYGTATVQKVKDDLLSTMAESHEVSRDEAKLSVPQEFLKSMLQIFTPLL